MGVSVPAQWKKAMRKLRTLSLKAELAGHELDFDNFGTLADIESLVRSKTGG